MRHNLIRRRETQRGGVALTVMIVTSAGFQIACVLLSRRLYGLRGLRGNSLVSVASSVACVPALSFTCLWPHKLFCPSSAASFLLAPVDLGVLPCPSGVQAVLCEKWKHLGPNMRFCHTANTGGGSTPSSFTKGLNIWALMLSQGA